MFIIISIVISIMIICIVVISMINRLSISFHIMIITIIIISSSSSITFGVGGEMRISSPMRRLSGFRISMSRKLSVRKCTWKTNAAAI